MKFIKTPIMLKAGYLDWVSPWRISEGEQFYMLGDFNGYCPIEFRDSL